jgi:hypothetical protein
MTGPCVAESVRGRPNAFGRNQPLASPDILSGECPVYPVVSTDRRNTFVKFLCGRAKFQSLPWTVIELTSDIV